MNEAIQPGLTAVGCAVIGWLLKLWPSFPNWAIPHAAVLCGAVGNFLLTDRKFSSAVIGAIIGASATGFHQIKIQSQERDPS